jgi:uncharacterized protein with ParB-like and HNH nuclease domain/predicted transport protein
MKATEANLLEFLKKSPQFVIPIYQRTYSWGIRECLQLWEDILRSGINEKTSAHFIGSIVYIEKGLYQISSQTPLLVIDGQQRLTTISLILEALSLQLGDSEPFDGFSAKKLRNYYLLNSLEDGDRKFKLILTQTDKSSLLALMQQKPLPKEHSIRVKENFEFFKGKINSLGTNLEPLCKGLAKLVIVDISLSRDQDNPQLIFESMNSTGKELSQADLIRNYILMGLEPVHQTRLYEDHWRPMEIEFGQEAYGTHFDRFMRHYLTIKTGEIPNIGQVYEKFKLFAQSSKMVESGVDALVTEIHTYAGYYCNMALGKEQNKDLSEAFQDLREFKVDVAYPFLLELYQDYQKEILSLGDFVSAVRLVESYVFRRAVCNIPTNSLNKTFLTLTKDIKKDRYLESTQSQFILLPSYRRFPNDEEFKRELKIRDLYNFPRRSYWLRRMENFDRKERVTVTEYTIEHILPQNEDLPKTWQTELGLEWKRIQNTWLHTLGNLTLTGYNSEYQDFAFSRKREMEGGFKHSPLKLNEGLGQLETWNEHTIQARADKLAGLAVKVWGFPEISIEGLEGYRKKASHSNGYSIEDHPYLSPNSSMRSIFEAFRKEVLALDPAVTEEFLKLYVAYKAETNFVDVVPQASRLCLYLNMPFIEINDQRNICKDVSQVGRWGNGDVEVGLKSLDELPYVMGLVRQSFEKQMGNGENL